MRQEDNSFFIEHKRPFSGKPIDTYHINLAFEFAYEMCFGRGHHRKHRSGGTLKRKGVELFANTFQGKLAEFCVYAEARSLKQEVSFPDLSVHGEGLWDESDLEIGDKKLSVKSMAYFSNLLLLEKADYNVKGSYIPSKNTIYDFIIAVRLKPDLKSVLRKERMLYNETVQKTELKKLVESNTWFYDISGGISNRGFREIITNNHLLPKGAMLNGKLQLDAENYYIELGRCLSLKELLTSNLT